MCELEISFVQAKDLSTIMSCLSNIQIREGCFSQKSTIYFHWKIPRRLDSYRVSFSGANKILIMVSLQICSCAKIATTWCGWAERAKGCGAFVGSLKTRRVD